MKKAQPINAFALTGRLVDCHYTQGAALGYELLGLQPVLEPHAILEYKSSPFGLTKTFACAHLFSPWQSESQLSLPIWLNENVQLAKLRQKP